MKFFQSMIGRRDRVRIEKVGSGVGNYISLVVRFGFSISFLLGGRRHARFFLAVAHYGRWLYKWRGGRFALVRYLKACQVTLMQLLASGPISDPRKLGGIHGRAGGKIPRVIPVYHRVAIRRGDTAVIRFWLSLLGIYRIIEVRGKTSFDTIYSPGVEKQFKQVYELGTFLDHIQKESTLGQALLKRRDLEREFKFAPRALLTSGANVPGGVGAFWAMAWDASIIWANRIQRVGQAFMDICILTKQVQIVELLKNCARLATSTDSIGSVSEGFRRRSGKNPQRWAQAFRSWSILAARKPEGEFGHFKWKWAPFQDFRHLLVLGRLHQIPEPAGKVRVVAMGTWWIQVLLFPLHRVLYSLLGSIPQDGTYNQTGPIKPFLEEVRRRLTHRADTMVFSFDLKAATDRFPIWYQIEVLSRLTTRRFAEAWRDLLVSFPYFTAGIGVSPRGQSLRYGSGQPMGIYSSWAMFSLCHHLLVQQAAHRAGYVGWYPWYILLGDDIVILGESVARAYEGLCSDLGVTIGLAKSLISSNGSFEFAKRFYYKGTDCSPISIREYSQALKSLPAFAELITRVKGQNPDLRLCDAVRAAKYGYHSVEKFTQRMVSLGNTRLANLLVVLMLPGGPFEQPLTTLLSPTSTVVRPDEDLVDTPITERRVKSVARTIGQSLVSVSDRVSQYAQDLYRYSEHLMGRDPMGILRYVISSRATVSRLNLETITSLGRIGRYLLDGKLRSRGLITLLGKVLPVWKFSTTDVASMPDPFSLDAVGGVLSRPSVVKFLKIRVRLLGLAWKGRPKSRVRAGGRSPKRK